VAVGSRLTTKPTFVDANATSARCGNRIYSHRIRERRHERWIRRRNWCWNHAAEIHCAHRRTGRNGQYGKSSAP